MLKAQKGNSNPALKTLKSKDILKNDLKEHFNNYISICSPNEKENKIKKKKFEKRQYNLNKRKNKSENNDNLEKRNISPLLVKFRNFYSLLYTNKHRSIGYDKNKKIEKKNKNFDIKCMNINKINFPLNFNDINCYKKEKNGISEKEKRNDKLLYLKTTNGIKSINSTFFYTSRKKMMNINKLNDKQKEPPQFNSNSLYKNIIKKFPSLVYNKDNNNKNKESNELNLPSITKKKNINLNLNELAKDINNKTQNTEKNDDDDIIKNKDKIEINKEESIDFNNNNIFKINK